jgi:hypothetical protein
MCIVIHVEQPTRDRGEMEKDIQTGKNLYTYNEVIQMLQKHYDNHKIKFPFGSREHAIVMRFFEPLQDDFVNLYLEKPLIKFNDTGSINRN